ncbi:MAG TPA: type IX secretion system membrane protein PorP/SprF, partial [Bacteroides sp.]|nr:type IX secretion system membrane protein PorP/SprF [Bacteroides sp.]
MRKLTTIGILFLMICGIGRAQNTKNYTPVNMYMLNPLLVNPAYSGARESMSFTTMLGANWVDMPNSQVKNLEAAGRMGSLTADFPLSEKNAVGLMIVQNKFGVNKNFAFYGHYSYRIITGTGKLSFGLRAGFNSYNRDLQQAHFREEEDPVRFLDYSLIYPNFGAGVYWYSDDYYVGLSIPDFFFPPLGSEAFDADPKNYMYT